MENQFRPTTKKEREVLHYLNAVRDSGLSNMFGMRSTIMEIFDVEKHEAGRLLRLWMDNFDPHSDYTKVKNFKTK